MSNNHLHDKYFHEANPECEVCKNPIELGTTYWSLKVHPNCGYPIKYPQPDLPEDWEKFRMDENTAISDYPHLVEKIENLLAEAKKQRDEEILKWAEENKNEGCDCHIKECNDTCGIGWRTAFPKK